MNRHFCACRFCVLLVAAGVGQVFASEVFDETTGYVTLDGTDTAGAVTSFNGAGHWSDGQAPHQGTNYFIGASGTLRTPSIHSKTNFVFAGDTLVVDKNGTAIQQGNGGTSSTTFPCLHVYNGTWLFSQIPANVYGETWVHSASASTSPWQYQFGFNQSVSTTMWTVFHGDETAYMKIFAENRGYDTTVGFKGDLSDYRGKFYLSAAKLKFNYADVACAGEIELEMDMAFKSIATNGNSIAKLTMGNRSTCESTVGIPLTLGTLRHGSLKAVNIVNAAEGEEAAVVVTNALSYAYSAKTSGVEHKFRLVLPERVRPSFAYPLLRLTPTATGTFDSRIVLEIVGGPAGGFGTAQPKLKVVETPDGSRTLWCVRQSGFCLFLR